MKSVVVHLTYWQGVFCCGTGRLRTKNARKAGRKEKFKNSLERECRGCAGELAVAKWLNVYWQARVDRPDDADLIMHDGRELEVKAAGYNCGQVLCDDAEPVDRIYIWAVPADHRTRDGWDVELVGWIPGQMIKKVGVWQPANETFEHDCWKISGRHLRPMSDLVEAKQSKLAI